MKPTHFFWLCLVLFVLDHERSVASPDDFTAQVRAAAIGRTNKASVQMFSSYVDGVKFVRNPAFWLRGLNGLTGIQVGYGPGATAITPWHVVGANHWKHDTGSKLVFCDLANHAVSRTAVSA